MKYRMYVDEVGNADLKNSQDPLNRFLSLTGVILEWDYIEHTVFPQIEGLKARFFGRHPDERVILHRKELIDASFPFERLADPVVRARFDCELLDLLSSWDYRVISVCIDKKRHKEVQTVWRYDPYHYCMEVLVEQYVFFLNRTGGQGDVLAESRGGREDMRLKQSFRELIEFGTHFIMPKQRSAALTSYQLKIKRKENNIAGLQLADLLAHPSRNEILIQNGIPGIRMAPFATRIIQILQSKYDAWEGVPANKFI